MKVPIQHGSKNSAAPTAVRYLAYSALTHLGLHFAAVSICLSQQIIRFQVGMLWDAKQLPDSRENFANEFRLTSPPALPVQTTADYDRTSVAAWTSLSLSPVATAERSRHP